MFAANSLLFKFLAEKVKVSCFPFHLLATLIGRKTVNLRSRFVPIPIKPVSI